MTKNLKKNFKLKEIFLDQKLHYTYPKASIEVAQATGEAYSPQKRKSSTSKHEISLLFSVFVSQFRPPESGSRSGFSNSNQCGLGSGSGSKTLH
jgi:hypothetical protein